MSMKTDKKNLMNKPMHKIQHKKMNFPRSLNKTMQNISTLMRNGKKLKYIKSLDQRRLSYDVRKQKVFIPRENIRKSRKKFEKFKHSESFIEILYTCKHQRHFEALIK